MYETSVVRLESRNTDAQLKKQAFEVIGNQSAGTIIDTDRFPALHRFMDSFIYSLLDRRSGSRINLEQLELDIAGQLSVTLDVGDGQQIVKPIDLSLNDICVESENGVVEHGIRVDITLRYKKMQVVLPAIAVRQNRILARTAFLFVGSTGEEDADSQQQLNSIFRALKAKANAFRRWRNACLLLSAICSILLVTWLAG